jgi:hypothetical protein
METRMIATGESKAAANLPYDSGIIELSLMLSRGQFDALEERASFEGMSVAQFLRRLVQESISQDGPIKRSR